MNTPAVLACVDGSSYAAGVCDHAAWMASRISAPLKLVHVRDSPTVRPHEFFAPLLDRLRNEGMIEVEASLLQGPFVRSVAQMPSAMIVMGKRGLDCESRPRPLGSNVGQMLRATTGPVLLTAKLFLPIYQALVLLDSDPDHRTAVDFVAGHPGLRELDIDLMMFSEAGQDPLPKAGWARSVLEARQAELLTTSGAHPNEAAARYMESRGADLIIVSREVLLADGSIRLSQIQERGLWGWRTPVLVC